MPPATATPATATPAQATAAYVAIVDDIQYTGNNLRIVDRTGRAVASTKAAGIDYPRPVGVGRRGVYMQTGDNQLSMFSPDGSMTPVATIPGASVDTLETVVESPDGTEWATSVVTFSSPNATSTSVIYVGTWTEAAPRAVATLQRPNSLNNQYAGGYVPLGWYSSGLLLGTEPTNVGGAGPFIEQSYRRSIVVVMDPATGVLTQPSPCPPYDVAGDGTVACVDSGAISVVGDDGTRASISTTGDYRVGEVAFVGGPSRLIYVSASEPVQTSSTYGWTDALHVATIANGAVDDRVLPGALCTGEPEVDSAHVQVMDASTVAVVGGTTILDSSAELIDVTTGATTSLGKATRIIGAIQGPG